MHVYKCFAVATILLVNSAAAQETPTTVYLEREPLVLRSPSEFQTPISLKPIREVTLTATTAGPVQTLLTSLGDDVARQAELVRIDSEEAELIVAREKAALEVARALSIPENPAEETARIKLAEADLAIAQLRLDRAILVSPFDGTVSAIHIVQGQFVRVATPLLTIFDDSSLTTLVPIDRSTAKVGETTPLDIEGQPYDGEIKVILPLAEEFEPLRDLFQSVACAVVEFKNSGRTLKVGQTVRSPLIPRGIVTEVPNAAVSTDETGVRRVFVIRDEIAVSVPVEVLSPVNQVETVVSGAFKTGDEVVTAGSDQLVDGRRVVPAALVPPGTVPGSTANPTQPGNTSPAGGSKPPSIGGF